MARVGSNFVDCIKCISLTGKRKDFDLRILIFKITLKI